MNTILDAAERRAHQVTLLLGRVVKLLDKFFVAVDSSWNAIVRLRIPSWNFRADTLVIYLCIRHHIV